MSTELARVQTEAQKQSFEANGFELYILIPNSGCCELCTDAAKKDTGYSERGVYKVSEMMPGENAAPLHPHCRCSCAAWEDSAEYEAWLEHLDKGGTTEGWEKLKKLKVDKSAKSGIINTKIKNDIVLNPMEKDRYLKMKLNLSRNCVTVTEAADDDLKYLHSLGAEASYGSGYILHIGEVPSASAMFEEIIHATQSRKYGEFTSSDETELFAREVAANRKPLINARAYGFDDTDVLDI